MSQNVNLNDETIPYSNRMGIHLHFLFRFRVAKTQKNCNNPDSKVHGANVGPIWGRQDPDGSHVGPMNFAIWEYPVDTGFH